MIDFDFHEVAFAVPLLALSIDALDRADDRGLILSSLAWHQRCWDQHRTLTDPAHVTTAAALRTAFRARTGPPVDQPGHHPPGQPPVGLLVGQRSLGDYDALFNIPTSTPETL